jgi:ABC-type transport system involved in multi-copper enzyme maturation permease subunit
MFIGKGIKALIAKEVREKIYGFLCFILVISGSKILFEHMGAEQLTKGYVSYMQVHLAAYCIVPMYALYLGISTFSYEKDKGTIAYLSSLPMKKSTLWMVKTFVGLLFCLGAIAVLPFIINDSTSFLPDGSLFHLLTKSTVAIVPAFLYIFATFSVGLLASVFCNTIGKAISVGVTGALALTGIIAALALLEPLSFVLFSFFVGGLAMSFYISPTRAVQSDRTINKRFALSSITFLAVVYLALFGWNQVHRFYPGNMSINSLSTSSIGPVLSVSAESLYSYGPVRPYVVTNESLEWYKDLRNHDFFTTSPDKKHVVLLDKSNHWGFYNNAEQLVIYGANGKSLFRGTKGFYTSPCWSRDGKKLAYLHKDERAFAFGERKYWNVNVLDLESMTSKKIHFTDHDFSEQPKLIGWRHEGTELLLSSSESLIVEVDKKAGDLVPNTILSINLEGEVTKTWDTFIKSGDINIRGNSGDGTYYMRSDVFDERSIISWCDGESKTIGKLTRGWSIESISRDGRWLAVSYADDSGYDRENGGPVPYNYYDDMKLKRSVSIIDLESLKSTTGNWSRQLTSEELNTNTIESYTGILPWLHRKVRDFRTHWDENEKAFIYFVPEGENQTILKYYYPESKERKTILTVEGEL